jgi:hypothetical protein
MQWTNADYNNLGWHDNRVHSIAIHASERHYGSLELDIDYILEWLRTDGPEFNYKVAPATLIFVEVIDLKVSLDYETLSAEVVPFSIDTISREAFPYPNGKPSFRWSIEIAWPQGNISFIAAGFTMTLRSSPIISDTLLLSRLLDNANSEGT